MKVKNMIKELQKFNPELDVYIPSGIADYDYTVVNSVRSDFLFVEGVDTEEEVDCVIIDEK